MIQSFGYFHKKELYRKQRDVWILRCEFSPQCIFTSPLQIKGVLPFGQAEGPGSVLWERSKLGGTEMIDPHIIEKDTQRGPMTR